MPRGRRLYVQIDLPRVTKNFFAAILSPRKMLVKLPALGFISTPLDRALRTSLQAELILASGRQDFVRTRDLRRLPRLHPVGDVLARLDLRHA